MCARPAPPIVHGRNLLHDLLLGDAHSFLPLPLAADPLILRWPPAGDYYVVTSVHPPSLLSRMRKADELLLDEGRVHGLPTLAPPPTSSYASLPIAPGRPESVNP